MQTKLTVWLLTHKESILREWRMHFITNTMDDTIEAGMETPGTSHEIIDKCYSDLILLLREKNGENILSENVVPHHSHNGFRLNLSYLTEILLSGEEVIRDILLLKKMGEHDFSVEEADIFFEAVNHAFQALIRHYSENFCGGCEKLLNEANKNLENACLDLQNKTLKTHANA